MRSKQDITKMALAFMLAAETKGPNHAAIKAALKILWWVLGNDDSYLDVMLEIGGRQLLIEDTLASVERAESTKSPGIGGGA